RFYLPVRPEMDRGAAEAGCRAAIGPQRPEGENCCRLALRADRGHERKNQIRPARRENALGRGARLLRSFRSRARERRGRVAGASCERLDGARAVCGDGWNLSGLGLEETRGGLPPDAAAPARAVGDLARADATAAPAEIALRDQLAARF